MRDILDQAYSYIFEEALLDEIAKVAVYKEFKAACDYFFEQRRKEHGKVEVDQHDNLVKKKAICETLEKQIAEGTVSQEQLQTFMQQFNEIGFVPRKDINKIKKQFHDVMTNYVAAIPNLSDEERERVAIETSLEELRNDPRADQKIFQTLGPEIKLR